MSDTPRVNGFEYSSASIKVNVFDESFIGWTGITWSEKLEIALSYLPGAGQAPQGDTAGKYVPENIKLSGLARSHQALRARLAAASASGTSYGHTRFAMVVSYFEEESDADPITIEFGGCRFLGGSVNIGEGPEGLIEENEISFHTLKRNGLTLYRDVDAA